MCLEAEILGASDEPNWTLWLKERVSSLYPWGPEKYQRDIYAWVP